MRLALVSILILSGCATTPIPSSEVAPPAIVHSETAGAARVIVKRDRGFSGVACTHVVMLDGKPIASLNSGQGVTLQADAGPHMVSVKNQGICGGMLIEAEVQASPSQVRTLRIVTDGMGAISLMPTAF